MTALESKPEASSETAYILDIYSELKNFGGSLLGYCNYYGIYDLDERNYISVCVLYVRSLTDKKEKDT